MSEMRKEHCYVKEWIGARRHGGRGGGGEVQRGKGRKLFHVAVIRW